MKKEGGSLASEQIYISNQAQTIIFFFRIRKNGM